MEDCSPDLLTSWLLGSEFWLFENIKKLWEEEEEQGQRATASVPCAVQTDGQGQQTHTGTSGFPFAADPS